MSNRIYLKITGYVDFDMLQNLRRKVLKFKKFDEKRATTPRWVIRFTSKLQGR